MGRSVLGLLLGKGDLNGYTFTTMRFAPALATVIVLALSACSKPAKVVPAQQSPSAKHRADQQGQAPSAKDPKVPDLAASPFPLTLWAGFLAARDYVDPSRFSNEAQIDAALAALETHEPKLFARRSGNEIRLWSGDWEKRYTMPSKEGMRELSTLLVQILNDGVRSLGLEGKKRHELEYAAFNGLLDPLDPHTNLLTPEQNASLGVRTRGHFGGIGSEIWAEARRIRIVRVLPGSPSERAGLMDNDLVYQIDGRSTVNMGAGEAQRLLRGPVDSKVKVIVRRKKQLKTITIKRGKISIPATRSFVLPDNTGYVELLTFQENCAKDTLEAMNQQLKAGAKALILDLRRNSGGLLTEAIALVDGFIEQGELISVLSREGKEVERAKPKISVPKDVPLVILISQSSASASEIVSGSLGTLGRAVVVGRRSFGKGSVQQLMPSKPYGEELALKLTVAEYRVANDTKIQGRGVVPMLSLYPMRLGDHRGVGAFFDIERFEEARESSVYARKKQETPEPSPFRLLYLARTPWEKFPRNIKDQAQRAWLDPELRIAGALAQQLAKAPKGSKPQPVVSQFVQAQTRVQEKALSAALKRWKIDWSADQSPVPPKPSELELDAKVIEIERSSPSGRTTKIRRKEQLRASALEIGDVFTLRLRLNNRSEQDLHRVHLRTKYFLPELDDLEIVYGKVRAHSRPYIDLRLQVPPGRSAHKGRYTFSVFQGANATTPILTKSLELAFQAPESPKIEFNYWIVDGPLAAKGAPARPKRESIKGEAPFVVSGNGDGQVAPGEKVLIAFEVLNRGKATASLPSVVVRNRSREQALLEEGAAPLDALKPGGRVYGAIAMTVSPSADPKKPIDLQLMVGDRKSSTVVERELHLPIKTPKDFQATAKRRWVHSKGELELRAEPSTKALLLGALTPKDKVRITGQQGSWLALEVGRGRVLWVEAKASDFETTSRARRTQKNPGLAALRSLVVPPELDLKVPRSSRESVLTLEGLARDDGEIEDLVIWVVPERPGARAKKVLYREGETSGSGVLAKTMPIRAKVELVPGEQRIRVIARDGEEVATSRDYWVRLDKG